MNLVGNNHTIKVLYYEIIHKNAYYMNIIKNVTIVVTPYSKKITF